MRANLSAEISLLPEENQQYAIESKRDDLNDLTQFWASNGFKNWKQNIDLSCHNLFHPNEVWVLQL